MLVEERVVCALSESWARGFKIIFRKWFFQCPPFHGFYDRSVHLMSSHFGIPSFICLVAPTALEITAPAGPALASA